MRQIITRCLFRSPRAVQYVDDLQRKITWPLTMTITQDESVVCYVITVIDDSLDDLEIQKHLRKLRNTCGERRL